MVCLVFISLPSSYICAIKSEQYRGTSIGNNQPTFSKTKHMSLRMKKKAKTDLQY